LTATLDVLTLAAPDEAAARRSLRLQIARLERRLADAVVASMPDGGIVTAVPALRGPRVLTLGELERLRDALAARVAEASAALEQRERRREDARRSLERMLLDPARHRHVRIRRRELGESGCGVWHVRPRLGLVGMLMGWWQVKLSSGCPLETPALDGTTQP
jgi:hypothetical protein